MKVAFFFLTYLTVLKSNIIPEETSAPLMLLLTINKERNADYNKPKATTIHTKKIQDLIQ